jgi:hypothetical protein
LKKVHTSKQTENPRKLEKNPLKNKTKPIKQNQKTENQAVQRKELGTR